ncbi:hypothetical protein FDB28_12630 [Clostridium botulinum]|nr:hypothetical protein [Clostridium botulinum]NFS95861.1 hypothetical protein [Clostridium botulinum]
MKKSIKKLIAIGIIASSICALNPIRANASWKQDSVGWWNTEGSSYSKGWKNIDGKWYYFYNNGYMAKNTTIGGYVLGSDGAWITGNNNVNSGLPINIPSNWVKLSDKSYAINSRSALVYDVKDTFGVDEDNVLFGIKESLILKTGYDVQEKSYNGNKATCFEYLDITNQGIEKFYYAVMFKDHKVYGFMICGREDNYEADKQELENTLNSTLVLK